MRQLLKSKITLIIVGGIVWIGIMIATTAFLINKQDARAENQTSQDRYSHVQSAKSNFKFPNSEQVRLNVNKLHTFTIMPFVGGTLDHSFEQAERNLVGSYDQIEDQFHFLLKELIYTNSDERLVQDIGNVIQLLYVAKETGDKEAYYLIHRVMHDLDIFGVNAGDYPQSTAEFWGVTHYVSDSNEVGKYLDGYKQLINDSGVFKR